MSPGPDKQFDREQVLEKAMQLFWEQGYESTGMSTLVERMGIGRQSLYDTFGDKRALFMETLAHYFSTRVSVMLSLLRAPGPALKNLANVFKQFERMSQQSGFCGCMAGNATAEIAHDDPEVARLLAGYYKILEDAFHDVLLRGQRDGDISEAIHPRNVARGLVFMAQGAALLSKLTRDPKLARGVFSSTLETLKAR